MELSSWINDPIKFFFRFFLEFEFILQHRIKYNTVYSMVTFLNLFKNINCIRDKIFFTKKTNNIFFEMNKFNKLSKYCMVNDNKSDVFS